MTRPAFARASMCALFVVVAGCGSDAARYGQVTISEEAPIATLSGRTAGETPALELSPGCAGFIDPSAPDHIVDVLGMGKIRVTATSQDGPVALVIERDGQYLCDSDENTGHEPAVQLIEPGRYALRVASLAGGAGVGYRLVVAPDDKERLDSPLRDGQQLSVSVTSLPTGASVQTLTGQVLGTTPAMFVVPAPVDGTPPRLIVSLDGHTPREVSGAPVGGQLVLHADLVPSGPTELALTANQPVPIRDFSTVEQSVTMERECTVEDASVDVAIRHTFVGDLMVQLRAPSGRTVTLQRYRGGGRSNLRRSFTSGDLRALRDLVGEQARGQWTLSVRDAAELDYGSFESFTLHLRCASGSSIAALGPPSVTQPRTQVRYPRPGSGQAPHIINPWGSAPAIVAPVQPAQPPNPRPATQVDPNVIDPWR